MDCTRFEELMFAALDGPLGDADEEARSAHAAACDHCHALERLMSTESPAPEAIPPEDLLESILAATSPGWARTLTRLDRELPGLAPIEPDAEFVADVLAATTRVAATNAATTGIGATDGATTGSTTAPTRRIDRLAAAWEALLRRPRLAFEGAYIGALALILFVGTPAMSPAMSISPGELITEIREGRVDPVVQSVNRRVEPMVASVSERVAGFASRTTSSASTRIQALWTNAVEANIDKARTLWCESFGCETDQPNESESNLQGESHA